MLLSAMVSTDVLKLSPSMFWCLCKVPCTEHELLVGWYAAHLSPCRPADTCHLLLCKLLNMWLHKSKPITCEIVPCSMLWSATARTKVYLRCVVLMSMCLLACQRAAHLITCGVPQPMHDAAIYSRNSAAPLFAPCTAAHLCYTGHEGLD